MPRVKKTAEPTAATFLTQHTLPLMNASGAFNPEKFGRMFPLEDYFAALVTKTVTPEPRFGNDQPRTVELPGVGMLNSIGLQNPGIANALGHVVPEWAASQVPVVLSLSAGTVDAFAELVVMAQKHASGKHISAFELNLSCPNVEDGGSKHFGSSPEWVTRVTETVRSVAKRPVFVKLTPNEVDIVRIAEAAVTAGASGLVAINTVVGMALDVKRRRPILPRVSGGYSGPGIFPIALNAVWRLHAAFPQTPIIAVGGAQSAENVLAFLMAGASVVQVGTSCFRDPFVFKTIAEELQAYAAAEKLTSWGELRGVAHPGRP